MYKPHHGLDGRRAIEPEVIALFAEKLGASLVYGFSELIDGGAAGCDLAGEFQAGNILRSARRRRVQPPALQQVRDALVFERLARVLHRCRVGGGGGPLYL